MKLDLRFGTQTCQLDVPTEKLLADCAPRDTGAIPDPRLATAQAIDQPLEFPPLKQTVIPGDHVAIVLECPLQLALPVLDVICERLCDAGVVREDIEIVQARRNRSPNDRVSPNELNGVRVRVHDPADRNDLSFLAQSRQRERIYLNRVVVDADAVLLVGLVEYDPILGFRGTTSGLYPGLADEAGQRRFRSQFAARRGGKVAPAARAEIDEIGWLLGVQFAVQLVRGAGNSVAQVLAGERSAVQRSAENRVRDTWRFRVPRPSEVVVACVADQDSTGFSELGRAAAMARRAVRQGGLIVLLSETNAEPGPALRWAQEAHEPAEVLKHLEQYAPSDSISTYQLADASAWAHVYVKSGLRDDLVESLFMSPLHDAAHAERLIEQAASCVLLRDAEHCWVTMDGES